MPNMKKISIAFITLLALSLTSSAAIAKNCINWPYLMNKYSIDTSEKGYRTTVVEEFDNYTKTPGDEWLEVGIPYIIAEYLQAAQNMHVLFGPEVEFHPAAKNAHFTIDGMFQHVNNMLRIFVKLNKGGGLIKQFQYEIAYPQNAQFFTAMKDVSIAVLAVVSPPYDRDQMEAVRTQTNVLPAYENYIRGLKSLWTYNIDRMDVTKTWFDESKKLDVHYAKAYDGLIDLYTFLAMYYKQNKGAFSQYFEMVEKEISDQDRFSIRPSVPKRPKRVMIKMIKKQKELRNRYLLGQSAFLAGLHAADKKQWNNAIKFLNEAVLHVPEDAITWYHLSDMYNRVGDKSGSSKARFKALELNKCLK